MTKAYVSVCLFSILQSSHTLHSPDSQEAALQWVEDHIPHSAATADTAFPSYAMDSDEVSHAIPAYMYDYLRPLTHAHIHCNRRLCTPASRPPRWSNSERVFRVLAPTSLHSTTQRTKHVCSQPQHKRRHTRDILCLWQTCKMRTDQQCSSFHHHTPPCGRAEHRQHD